MLCERGTCEGMWRGAVWLGGATRRHTLEETRGVCTHMAHGHGPAIVMLCPFDAVPCMVDTLALEPTHKAWR